MAAQLLVIGGHQSPENTGEDLYHCSALVGTTARSSRAASSCTTAGTTAWFGGTPMMAVAVAIVGMLWVMMPLLLLCLVVHGGHADRPNADA